MSQKNIDRFFGSEFRGFVFDENLIAQSELINHQVELEVEKEHAFRFLIYVNVVSFIVIFLAANGLGVSELIKIIGWVFFLFSFVLVINVVDFIAKKIDQFKCAHSFRLGLSYLIYDFVLAGILLVNAFAIYSAPISIAVVAMVMGGFMSLVVSPRSMLEFFLGKSVLLAVSLYALSHAPGDSLTMMFPLLVAFILMTVPAYWLLSMRRRVLGQSLQQQQMLGQLQKETNLRERLLTYVGHDLRQPINALGMLLHALPEGDTNVIEAKECVRSSKRLISDIVQVSDVEKELNVHVESFAVQSLFDSIKLEYSFLANQADCELRIVDTSAVIHNDPKFVARIIKNFVTNAIIHAAGSTILVGVRRRRHSIDILVLDSGQGIPDEDKTIIFDEFVKGESSCSDIGFGLGLAIAKHYASECKAEILFDSTSGQGAMFGLRLPIKNDNSN